MRKYRFSTEQRFALWRAYREKCFWCGEPIAFREVTVDHVLPERLLEEPDELGRIRQRYGLGDDFSINDYCNWVASHAHCNREKGTALYEATPAFVKVLHEVRAYAETAEAEAERSRRNVRKGELLARLGIAFEQGIVSQEEVASVLDMAGATREFFEPIVVTFGLEVAEVLASPLAENGMPTDFARLCEWLEGNLVSELSSSLSCSFYFPEPSSRTGESLSVRVACLSPDLDELGTFRSPWWKMLEIRYYSEVYGEGELRKRRSRERLDSATIISDREFFELLLRGAVLIGFRRVTQIDYRAIAMSQDYALYQSDSYYDLGMWRETLELAGVEDWEIEEAFEKAGTGI